MVGPRPTFPAPSSGVAAWSSPLTDSLPCTPPSKCKERLLTAAAAAALPAAATAAAAATATTTGSRSLPVARAVFSTAWLLRAVVTFAALRAARRFQLHDRRLVSHRQAALPDSRFFSAAGASGADEAVELHYLREELPAYAGGPAALGEAAPRTAHYY